MKTLVINLPSRVEKLKLFYEHWSWLETEKVDGVLSDNPHTGCGLAHINAIRKGLEHNDWCLVLEDDARLFDKSLFFSTIHEAVDRRSEWDTVFLCAVSDPLENSPEKVIEVSSSFIQVSETHGIRSCHAMLWSKSALPILKEYETALLSGINIPIDRLLTMNSWGPVDWNLPRVWMSKKALAYQEPGLFSDNENAAAEDLRLCNIDHIVSRAVPDITSEIVSLDIQYSITCVVHIQTENDLLIAKGLRCPVVAFGKPEWKFEGKNVWFVNLDELTLPTDPLHLLQYASRQNIFYTRYIAYTNFLPENCHAYPSLRIISHYMQDVDFLHLSDDKKQFIVSTPKVLKNILFNEYRTSRKYLYGTNILNHLNEYNVHKPISSYCLNRIECGKKPILLIIGCEKYINSLNDALNIDSAMIRSIGVVGRFECNVINLDCNDSYECLPEKLWNSLKYIQTKYPNTIGIFKTDDDIRFNIPELLRAIQNRKETNYWGLIIDELKEPRYPHERQLDKHTEKRNCLINRSIYCFGWGYWISQKSINLLLSHKDTFETSCVEDITVGEILNKYDIFPIQDYSIHFKELRITSGIEKFKLY